MKDLEDLRVLKDTKQLKITQYGGFPGGSQIKYPPANAGDVDSIHDQGRSHIPRSN